MKKQIRSLSYLLSATLFGFYFLASHSAIAANGTVCPSGTGVPPFLSAGADPNLLLILDNSGSMLDMAYVENIDECVDNAYVATDTYAGYFDSTKWYKWTDGVAPWVSGTIYAVGQYVYTEGIFYKATTAGTSVGAEIKFDSSVIWDKVWAIDTWVHGTTYAAGDIVQFESQLYKATNSGLSSDPDFTDDISIDDANGNVVIWEKVDSTWISGGGYDAEDIVSDNGMLFENKLGTNTIRPSEDTAEAQWHRLNAGYFEETTAAAAATALAAADLGADPLGNSYIQSDLYVNIVSAYDADGVLHESTVSCFAASGNLLNWASASKFDIQKKILTGGKYDANEKHLVSQSRGCSDHSFYKEVPVTDSGGVSKVLTLGTKGPSDEEWIDSTDFTTRISILGVGDGFADSVRAEACEAAVDAVLTGSLGDIHQDVPACLDVTVGTQNIMTESNSAFNHALWSCWKIRTAPYDDFTDLGQMSEVLQSCEHIYRLDMPPATITTDFAGYVCYGLYNGDSDPLNADPIPDEFRTGYVGRCWEPSSIPAGCATISCPAGKAYDTENPRCFTDNLMYECSGNYNAQQDSCNKPWVLQFVDIDGVGPLTCTAADIAAATPAKWTDDNNTSADVNECIQQGVWDYCQGIAIPEVIDPSDQVFDTNVSWGLPGAFIDSGIISMLGTDRPLLVMPGYIKKTPEASGAVLAPVGILHDVADDLRIGIMAFNDNGAATECANNPTDDTIVQYCSDSNKDGAELLVPIGDGETVLDEIVSEISDLRATSWTPLAEALYNAIGYFGQNSSMRLDTDDFEISATADPVQYWCQDNHILLITEGSSTADIHLDISTFVSTYNDGDSDALEGECLLYGSTYLDDLTWFGQSGEISDIYATPQLNSEDKQNITTHIVTTGSLRDDDESSLFPECNPATIMENAATNGAPPTEDGSSPLYSGENPEDLKTNLQAALADILSRVSAGSAASVISSSRSGSGAVFQAIFWPQKEDSSDHEVTWVGDVHALFLDSKGLLWEDTDQDALLDKGEDHDGDSVVDHQITFFFDSNNGTTRACKDGWGYPDSPCDEACVISACNGDIVEIGDVNYIWAASMPGSSSSWLTNSLLDPDTQRSNYISADRERYIFTWTDLDNDGIVDSDWNNDGSVTTGENDADGLADQEEMLPFVVDFVNNKTVSNRGPVVYDFNVADGHELNRVITWLRGNDTVTEDADLDGFKEASEDDDGDGILDVGEDDNNNEVLDPAEDLDNDGDTDEVTMRSRLHEGETWRLGDVIHSTPILVGRPLEAYHYIYKDPTYAVFADHYNRRRQMVYFGANDGMLHAVNAGFFIESKSRFCRSDERDADGDCDTTDEVNHPYLGAELWAYVPYNLHPHLKCLTDPDYDHKYYVDQRPRIFDVQIFEEESICSTDINNADCDHPRGWGTILVGSMRFGGTTVSASDLNSDVSDTRQFTSAFFILDVTNPEKPPKLLAEMTMTSDVDGSSNPLYTDLGYTTSSPAMVFMREDDGSTSWHLILGNGPTTLKGENSEQGKIAVLPLSWITGEVDMLSTTTSKYPSMLDRTTRKAFRIPNLEPDSSTSMEGGYFTIPAAASGDTESFVADIVSVDFDVESPGIAGVGSPYKVDAVYFGTTDGSGFTINAEGDKIWNGGGRMYRLVTKELSDLDSDGDTEFNEQVTTQPWDWDLQMLIDAKGPISSAPSIGWDGYNFWVYFGTGRFYDDSDKTDNQTQRFFGLKEPVNCTNNHLTWDSLNWWDTTSAKAPNPANAVSERGLMQVDQILVEQFTGDLFCLNDITSNSCKEYPDGSVISSFYYLKDYIVGESCSQTDDPHKGLDGWFREFYDERERNIGQATLLGGLLTFTSYQPYDDVCKAEGLSYLYGVHYQTGTAWIKNVFGTYDLDADTTIVKDRLDLGKGLALTPSLHVGAGDPDATAFVQTSTGEIWEVGQEDLPLSINIKSGRTSWQQK